MYLNIGYGCKLTSKKDLHVLYDLVHQKTYFLDDEHFSMLKTAVNGSSLEDMEIRFGETWMDFLVQLQKYKCVYFSHEKINSNVTDPFIYGNRNSNGRIFGASVPTVNQLEIQVNSKCSRDCPTCNLKYDFPCMLCYTTPEISNHKLRDIDLKKIATSIKRLEILHLSSVTFSGGEPLENLEEIEYIINHTHSNHISYNVLTNGLLALQNKHIITKLKELNINLILTKVKELAIEQKTLLEYLAHKQIPYIEITTKIDRTSIDTSYKTHFIDTMNIVNTTNIQENTLSGFFNKCLNGKIYISLDGNTSTCRELLNQGIVAGNLFEKNDIGEIMGEIVNIWKDFSLDKNNCITCDFYDNCVSCLSIKKSYADNSCFCNLK